MNDPYQVLGVTPDATDEEIKKAYREMAKKYHPDNYANTEFSDIANEKMKSINEAYDAILRERAGGGPSGASGEGEKDPRFARIRELIRSGRYTEAEVLLDQDRMESAEWYYLKGLCAMYSRRYNDASSFFSRASSMEPGNAEYASMYQRFHRTGSAFSPGGNPGECSCCDMCSALLCADCMCECCGGDLIRCC
ncbi:MAG: J domain-containing protein [Clostridia bacterium]|nr:J domain-containing protein [Clostridia bacterium]